MRKLHLIILLLILSLPGMAQQNTAPSGRFTISGEIKDARTGEELIGASVAIKELPGKGTVSNAYGFYSITLPGGTYTIILQFLGYEPQSQSVVLNRNVKLDFILGEKSNQLQEVEVSTERKDDNVTRNQMGVDRLEVKEINQIPVLFGEKDVLKTIQLLPGIQPVGEGSSGFYVRGGDADENLILLDEATVYNASHLLGFFSVFNSDAIKDITIYKGGEPAEYGGRLSSVEDIKMNEGNNKNMVFSGGIGLIDSRLNVEGPIVKNKGSFSISARRTYADLFLKLSKDTLAKRATLYFYDINAKANYELNDKNRIFLSGYFGKDVLGFSNNFGLDWGNATGTLRWNHLFSQKMFSNTSLIFSKYNYNVSMDADNNLNVISQIKNVNLKQDFQYYINPDNTLKFGFNSIYHTIIPGAITANSNSFNLTNQYAWENALYASQEIKLNDKMTTEYGLRLTSFSLVGPGSFNTYDSQGNTLDSITYRSGQFVKTYINPEPRFNITYLLNGSSSVKASYDRNVQNLHMITNSTSSNPISLWKPSSKNIKPELADQVALGYYRNFNDNSYEFSTEVYYKWLYNQIDYRNGAQLNFNENVESQLLYGKGRAYGVEFYVKKKYGKLNGWISYTLSRTEKKFAEINNGNYYPATQDRTHDISIVGIYNMSDKWNFSATWVYYTGNAVTFPSGKYIIDGRILNYYTERNGYRMPPYHRLDVGATYYRKRTEKSESSWTFSIYNLYARANAYTITFRQDPDNPDRSQAIKTSLFKIVPSITYNFKF